MAVDVLSLVRRPILIPVSIKLICAASVLGLAADVVPMTGAVDTVGRLSLDGVLILAVLQLWKALGTKDQRIAEKDAQLVAMTGQVTQVMTQVLEAVKEQRLAVNELRDEFARVGIAGPSRRSAASG